MQTNNPNPKTSELNQLTNHILPTSYYSNPSPHTNNPEFYDQLQNINLFSITPTSEPYQYSEFTPTIIINYNPETQQPTILTTYLTPEPNQNSHTQPNISPTHPNIYTPI